MVELCKILSLSINYLFSGEIVDKKNNERKLEDNFLEMTKLQEKRDKQLIKLETIIGYTSSISFITLIYVASYIKVLFVIKVILILIGFTTFII